MDAHLNLEALVGKKVRIDRGGPESREGRLLSVKPDYLVLYCDNEGVVYYKLHHIRSITYNTQDYSDIGTGAAYEMPEYLEADSFSEVLKGMVNRWVQLNRGGPERLEGVLVDCDENQSQLVVKNQLVHVSNFHLRNVSFTEQKQDEVQEEEQDQQQDQSSPQKDQSSPQKEQSSSKNSANAKNGKSSGKKSLGKRTKRLRIISRKAKRKAKK